MAREVGVSEATVVRTARALGFSGYPQFREAFRSNFLQRMSTVTRVRLSAPARRKETDIAAAVLETEFSNLEATRLRLDPKALGRAVELIINARTVYVVGMRSAYSLAWLLHFSLTLIRARSHLLTLGVGEIPELLEGINGRDVVVGISFERYASATVSLFRACLDQGARGIASPTSRRRRWPMVRTCSSRRRSAVVVHRLVCRPTALDRRARHAGCRETPPDRATRPDGPGGHVAAAPDLSLRASDTEAY